MADGRNGDEPTAEDLTTRSFENLQAACREVAADDFGDLRGAVLVAADDTGISLVPHVHHDCDPQEVSLWLLGAMLAHLEDSAPDGGAHPLAIADHALSLMDDYEDDPHVGWSHETDVDGRPWEGRGDA